MENGVHVRPCRVDGAVYEALKVERARLQSNGGAVVRELDDIAHLDNRGACRAGQEMARRIVWMTDADMAIRVEHAHMRQDAIGDHEVLLRAIDHIHGGRLPFLRASEIRRSMKSGDSLWWSI